jgi:hypothetical protein
VGSSTTLTTRESCLTLMIGHLNFTVDEKVISRGLLTQKSGLDRFRIRLGSSICSSQKAPSSRCLYVDDALYDLVRGRRVTAGVTAAYAGPLGGAAYACSRISYLFPSLVCLKGQRGCIRILLDGRATSNLLIVDLFTKVFWEILSMSIGEKQAHISYRPSPKLVSIHRKARYHP